MIEPALQERQSLDYELELTLRVALVIGVAFLCSIAIIVFAVVVAVEELS